MLSSPWQLQSSSQCWAVGRPSGGSLHSSCWWSRWCRACCQRSETVRFRCVYGSAGAVWFERAHHQSPTGCRSVVIAAPCAHSSTTHCASSCGRPAVIYSTAAARAVICVGPAVILYRYLVRGSTSVCGAAENPRPSMAANLGGCRCSPERCSAQQSFMDLLVQSLLSRVYVEGCAMCCKSSPGPQQWMQMLS